MTDTVFADAKPIDLRGHLQNSQLISFSMDWSGKLYVLALVGGPPQTPYERAPSYDFEVIEATEHYMITYRITEQKNWFHHAQPLPNDELLLVSGTSRQQQNALTFTKNGSHVGAFALGDDIAEIYTTREGHIWASYDRNGGTESLVRWGSEGVNQYAYSEFVITPYALNVVSSAEVWHYAHPGFSLVKIVNDNVAGRWQSPIRYAHKFAIWQQYAVFAKDERLTLLKMESDRSVTPIKDFDVLNKDDRVSSRANYIVVNRNLIFHKLNIADLVKSV